LSRGQIQDAADLDKNLGRKAEKPRWDFIIAAMKFTYFPKEKDGD
jgi:hypothetical protein